MVEFKGIAKIRGEAKKEFRKMKKVSAQQILIL
ncbi:MAG: hypothetical protein HJHJAOHD_00984 [Flavobacteriales bacterium]|nr:hypothetical protein [Flavobacteriales bacterium]